MKRMLVFFLTLALLVSGSVLCTSAISVNVDNAAFEAAELKALYYTAGAEIYSDLNEDYFDLWWEDEVPEVEGGWLQAATVNMRGFGMSADGRYLYMGTLNGGSGIRGVVVFDTQKGAVSDLYYHYDGEVGLTGSPFSYAKGISADDRGYVYVGYAFSKNYNVVNLGIAEQKDDGTLEEVYFGEVYEFGDPGDESGIHVGVNGVDVVKMGDKYYCYVMVNYDYDALYCFDVTDPANPKPNKDFGENGVIIFSESDAVSAAGFTLKEGQYLDVDDDGTIWLVVNANEGKDGIMKIAPDGSACAEVVELAGIYCVEHEGGYLLCGMKDGGSVIVKDDASYETIATIEVPADFGDRVTRILIINDVLFVCDAGSDSNNINAVHAAPLSAEGQDFFDSLVACLSTVGETEAPAETEASAATEAPAETEAPAAETEAPAETKAPTADSDAPAETEAPAESETPAKGGCGGVVSFGAVAVLVAAAAAVALKKKD